jgi:uncharacterized membrane protein (DUF4010 family)
MDFIEFIPDQLIEFLLVTVYSLIIGMTVRRLYSEKEGTVEKLFGTDRTLTFVGILGYILYMADPEELIPYLGGGLIVSFFLGIYYWRKTQDKENLGFTTMIVALITYCIPLLVITQPQWFTILVVVTVLFFTESKKSFVEISRKFDKDEFITLAKFLVIAGVVLPILPNEPIVPFLEITPFNIWIAVVVISGISYFSYLLRKFVFRNSGIIISAILGGLYSSTATTIILSKKGKANDNNSVPYSIGIILSMAMMYFRIMILVLIFNKELAIALSPYLAIMIFVSIAAAGFIYIKNKKFKSVDVDMGEDKNPLEFKVALIFTLLFISFSFITYFVIDWFGVKGLNILSWIVGISDIDPFLLNLFQGKFSVPINIIALSSMQAIISNNVLKTLYSAFLSGPKLRKNVIIGMTIIIACNLLILLFLI